MVTQHSTLCVFPPCTDQRVPTTDYCHKHQESPTAIDLMMNAVEWKPIESDSALLVGDDLPYATHEGVLNIGGSEFKCYQLNTGARVISEESLIAFFGGATEAKNIEDCITCGHSFAAHTVGNFKACSEADCGCTAYWDSEDRALANAD